ncbi:MAG: aspartate aminotransferase family protein, partial [Methanobacteriota archaeon]
PTNMPCSLFVSKARGSHIWDVDGNEYIDYRMGFGPVILGHSDSRVHERVHAVDEQGLVYALSHELEVTVAKKIVSMVPCAEMIRFCNSGTEATMHAIRVARAYTKREAIMKFEGMYHGAHDYLLFSTDPPFDKARGAPKSVPMSAGIPRSIQKMCLVERWNDFDRIEKLVKRRGAEIAAIITEPIMGNCAAILPRDGYLKDLRQLCSDHGILLIFDEVKTGFRVAPGGAQERFGVTPDLATFAKSMGNGYPVACFAGSTEVMNIIGPAKVVHGGTYSGNPVSLAAVDATLDILRTGKPYEQLESFGKRLMRGLQEVAEESRVPMLVTGVPEMFQILFTRQREVHEYRDLAKCDLAKYAVLHVDLLNHGVMIDEDNMECFFTCEDHGDEDLERTIAAFHTALGDLAAGRGHAAQISGAAG